MRAMDINELVEEIKTDTVTKATALTALAEKAPTAEEKNRLTDKRDMLTTVIGEVLPVVETGAVFGALFSIDDRAAGLTGGELEGCRLAGDVIRPLARLLD